VSGRNDDGDDEFPSEGSGVEGWEEDEWGVLMREVDAREWESGPLWLGKSEAVVASEPIDVPVNLFHHEGCHMRDEASSWSGHLLNVSSLPRSGGILSSTTQASGLMRGLTKRATVLQGVRFTGSC
jgi:hypothetical protein